MFRSKICLSLTAKTIEENLAYLDMYRNWIDVAELRADCLTKDEQLHIRNFPERAGVPCILSFKRAIDGGNYLEGEASRTVLFARALAFADPDISKNFAYIDLESNFNVSSLQDAALAFGTKIIRSYYTKDGSIQSILQKMGSSALSGVEIPKIEFTPKSLADVTSIFRQAKSLKQGQCIISANGPYASAIKILASKLGSYLCYTSPEETLGATAVQDKSLLVSPKLIARTYRQDKLDAKTSIYGIAGKSILPLSKIDFLQIERATQKQNALFLPILADKIEEVLDFAEELSMPGVFLSSPFKETVINFTNTISEKVGETGTCNAICKTNDEWVGYNTCVNSFLQVLVEFLQRKSLFGMKVAIIGGGSMAKTAAYVVKQLGGKACIFNRTASHAKAIAERYNFKWATLSNDSQIFIANYSDLIIQATSVGMQKGFEANKNFCTSQVTSTQNANCTQNATCAPCALLQSKCADPIPNYEFKGNEKVFECIYAPKETALLRRAREAGCTVCNGEELANAQKKRIYTLFTGVPYEQSDAFSN